MGLAKRWSLRTRTSLDLYGAQVALDASRRDSALGLEPGDRVGIWAPNCAEWTIVQFATAKAG